MKVIGLISGTSTDGIDAALVEITGRPPDGPLKLLRFATYSYSRSLRERIFKLSASGGVKELTHLHFYLGELFAKAALRIAGEAGFRIDEIDLIGSHGQTVCHLPHPKREPGYSIRSTLQIAEPSVIAQRTGVTTVADFRPRDIAAGGHGAPLTPRLHFILFHHPSQSRLVVNIGGISNMTYLPAQKGPEEVIAFDTGPGNMLIDGIVQDRTGGRSRMDRGGRLARKGRVHEGLLKELLRDPFLRRRPPKTTGRESFGRERVKTIIRRARALRLSTPDLLATATLFTARSIAESYFRFVRPLGGADEMIVGGGGTRNTTLLQQIRVAVSPVSVKTFEDYGMDSKAIEAIAFALLAYETVLGVPNNVPSATGAREPIVMGKIIPGKGGLSIPLTFPPSRGTPASPHP